MYTTRCLLLWPKQTWKTHHSWCYIYSEVAFKVCSVVLWSLSLKQEMEIIRQVFSVDLALCCRCNKSIIFCCYCCCIFCALENISHLLCSFTCSLMSLLTAHLHVFRLWNAKNYVNFTKWPDKSMKTKQYQ